jgi:hypothetical protein
MKLTATWKRSEELPPTDRYFLEIQYLSFRVALTTKQTELPSHLTSKLLNTLSLRAAWGDILCEFKGRSVRQRTVQQTGMKWKLIQCNCRRKVLYCVQWTTEPSVWQQCACSRYSYAPRTGNIFSLIRMHLTPTNSSHTQSPCTLFTYAFQRVLCTSSSVCPDHKLSICVGCIMVCACIHVCMYVCMHVCMWVYVYIFTKLFNDMLTVFYLTVTMLRAGRAGTRSPAGARHFCLLQIVETGSGAHPASNSMRTGALSRV